MHWVFQLRFLWMVIVKPMEVKSLIKILRSWNLKFSINELV